MLCRACECAFFAIFRIVWEERKDDRESRARNAEQYHDCHIVQLTLVIPVRDLQWG